MAQIMKDKDQGGLPVKPRLRGWIHAGALPLSILGGVILLRLCSTSAEVAAVAVYLAASIMLYGNSAAYHLGNWSPKVKATLRRIDHANINIFIAGTYSPLAAALLAGNSRLLLLWLIWSVALVGVLFRIFWLTAPRALYVSLYLIMGWISMGWLYQFWKSGGWAVVVLMLSGGLLYSLGAVAYGCKRPNPSPEWFGFHEVFHTGTVLAAGCFYGAIVVALLRGTGA